MGIEAELKARVRDPDRVWGLLRQRATQQNSVYYNVYFDTPDRTLTRSGRGERRTPTRCELSSLSWSA